MILRKKASRPGLDQVCTVQFICIDIGGADDAAVFG